MPRHANLEWNLPLGTPSHRWESIHAALLMDIRDELRQINRTLGCRNFVDIPKTLRGIRRDMKAAGANRKA